LEFLDKQDATKKANAETILNSMVAQGIKSDDLTDEDVRTLSSQLGVTENELATIYKGLVAQNQPEDTDLLSGTSADLKDYNALLQSGNIPNDMTYLEYQNQLALAKKVSTTKTTPDTIKPLSVWEIEQLKDLYPDIDIKVGDTMEDVKRKQVEKFIDDNKDKVDSGEVTIDELKATVPETHRNIFEKIALGIYRGTNKLLGIKEKTNTQEELTNLWNSI